MSFLDAMKEIESHTFAARMNVASDFRTFLHGAKNHMCVKFLLKETKSIENLDQLTRRLFELSREKVDPRYENPWDTALTIYLWTISLRDANLAKTMAEVVVQAPQCWWATKLARHIMLDRQLQNNAGNFCQQVFDRTSPTPIQVQVVSNAGEAILYSGVIAEMRRLPVIVHTPANMRTMISQASQYENPDQLFFRAVTDSKISNPVPA